MTHRSCMIRDFRDLPLLTLEESEFNGDKYTLLVEYLSKKYLGYYIFIVSDNLADDINGEKIEIYFDLCELPSTKPGKVERLTFKEWNKKTGKLDFGRIKEFTGDDTVF